MQMTLPHAEQTATDHRRPLLGMALVALMLPTLAQADKLDPQKADRNGEWDYAIYMGGLRVMDFRLFTTLKTDQYQAELVGETRGLADLLARRAWTLQSEGMRTATGGFSPTEHYRHSAKRGEDRHVTLHFADMLHITADPPYPPEELDGVLDLVSLQTHDPLTAFLSVLLSGDQATPCAIDTQSFDGKRLYQLKGVAVGTSTLPISDYNSFAGPALRCDISITRVGESGADLAQGATDNLDPDSALQETLAKIWLAVGLHNSDPVLVKAELHATSGFHSTIHLQSPVAPSLGTPQIASRPPR